MPVYALGERVPDIHADAYVHPDAVVIGDVTIGAGSTVWPGRSSGATTARSGSPNARRSRTAP